MTKAEIHPDVWPGMTATTWQALGEYVRWMADRLWLRDWTITLNREPLQSDNPAYAYVLPTEGRKLAKISFCHDFASMAVDVIENSVIHELIHCCHRDMTDVIRCNGNDHLIGKQAWDVLWESFRVATEVFVDSMANSFQAQVSDKSMLEALLAARDGKT